MNQPDCLFCKIAAGEIPSACILENSEFKVILDRFPGNKGHVLIIPKTHVENIFDMDPELGGRLFTLAVRLSKTLKETFDMEGMNVLQNNGKIAGQTVFHFHLHLIPRYKDDQVTIKWKAQEPTDEELNEIVEKIKDTLK